MRPNNPPCYRPAFIVTVFLATSIGEIIIFYKIFRTTKYFAHNTHTCGKQISTCRVQTLPENVSIRSLPRNFTIWTFVPRNSQKYDSGAYDIQHFLVLVNRVFRLIKVACCVGRVGIQIEI